MNNIQDLYELSPMQQGMLFHRLYQPESPAYFEQRSCLLTGDLNPVAFRQAWQDAIARHDGLRASLNWEETDKPIQVVHGEITLPWTEEDWQHLDSAAQETKLEEFLERDRQQGFDFVAAPLMRCALIRLSSQRYRFVWSHHHILMDGWCNALLIQEILASYEANCRGQSVSLPPAPKYRDYILWLQEQGDADAYWKSALAGFSLPTPLPFVHQRSGSSAIAKLEEFTFALSSELTQRLQTFAQENRLTLNTLVQGVWAILLGQYSQTDKVIFGATVSGRPPQLPGIESTLGLFINTLPVTALIDSTQPLISWLRSLQQSQQERESYSYSALTQIQAASEVPTGTPLFESLLVFENYPASLDTVIQGQDGALQISDGQGFEQTHYGLTLVAIPGTQLRFRLSYDSQTLNSEAVSRIAKQLEHLFTLLLDSETEAVADMLSWSLVDQSQVESWNQTTAEIPSASVPQLIFERAEKEPDAIAVRDDEKFWTNAELIQQVNQLTGHLQKSGIKKGDRLGICLPRTGKMVIALLATLQVGATYVPLDPSYPLSRLQYISQDAQLQGVISTGSLAELTSQFGIEGLNVDIQTLLALDHVDSELPEYSFNGEDIAYLLYTSGSTGKPKGVPIRHNSLVNLLWSMKQKLGITTGDRFLAVTTLAFDIAALELFLPLIVGAELVIASTETARNGEQLLFQLQDQNITAMQATPTTWQLLLAQCWQNASRFKALCGGEALEISLAQSLLNIGCELWNLYGPTETTIWSGALQITGERLVDSVPIGGAIANTKLLVLDEAQRPVPIGASGELYIGGLGLSPGYFNRDDLTQERFVSLPAVDGGIWYRTGDRVRYQPDGTLTYLGRLDYQLKLRGFRIEAGEIEAVLTAHEAVKQALVVLDAASPQLIAYILGDTTAETEVVEQISQQLPRYMVPAAFVWLEAWPLTPNGKIDRKALPKPNVSVATEATLVSESEPVEALLAGIWQQVLGHPVQPDDHFFEVGGHSLSATSVIAQVKQLFGVDIPLKTLFDTPQLSAFARAVETARNSRDSTQIEIEKVDRSQPLRLSHAQYRQWILAQLEPDSPFYWITATVKLTGSLSIDTLRDSLKLLSDRHDVLRTQFEEVDGQPTAVVLPDLGSTHKLLYVNEEAPRSLRLDQAPLWRVHLEHESGNEALDSQLTLTLHHIISDGWSIGLIVRDLSEIYQALNEERSPSLPEPSIQYVDYAHYQRQWLESETAAQQLEYWKTQLADAPTQLELPTDYSRPVTQTTGGETHHFEIPSELAHSLEHLSRQQSVTLFMTLLGAFKVLLYRYSQQSDLLVGTPIANRQHPEFEGLMGLFVNTLVLRTNLEDNPSFTALLEQIRNTALDAYANQDVPFDQVIDALEIDRSASQTPLFQVMFVLQNAPLTYSSPSGLNWEAVSLQGETAKFDLTLSMTPEKDRIRGGFEYRSDLFDSATIERMAGHFIQILEAIAQQPQQRVSNLNLLTPAEKQQLQTWQNPHPNIVSAGLTIPQAWTQQVEANPEAIALVYKNQRFTYETLERQSSRLANVLIERGVTLESSVGIWVQRDPHSIVAMLAILKAGGHYVPLDPSYPEPRLQQMIQETKMELLLTTCEHAVVPASLSCETLWVGDSAIASHSSTSPIVAISSDTLAYILYTSGSTGIPKGVSIPHSGVVRLVKETNYVSLDCNEVILQAAPLTFDASTFEIWGALLNGGRVVLSPQAQPNLSELAELIQSKEITTLWLTAGLFRLMVEEQPEALFTVRQLLAGGDVLSVPHIKTALEQMMPGRVINGYGPTENTTFSCCYPMDDPDGLDKSVPIGTAIAQTQTYVLDQHFEPVPVGVPGELFLGGAGLARGYLNRPDLTAERFVPNPFWRPNVPGTNTLYRTGDRVRYSTNGEIEYLGRLDLQVKIRGFRFELGEVESAIQQHPQVQGAIAKRMPHPAGHDCLVAYVVANNLSNAEIRSYLETKLPDYMLPSQWVWVEALPLTKNGKVDRQALPEPDWQSASENITAPQTDIERSLAHVWETILNRSPIGIHENFFELGGDSIMAIQIVSRARNAGINLSPQQLFQHQTVATLAAAVELQGDQSLTIAQQGTVTGSCELSPIQRWFFNQNLAQPNHFNQALYLELPREYDRVALESAIQAVIEYHDGLHVRFQHHESDWIAQLPEERNIASVHWVDLSSSSEDEQNQQIAQQVQQWETSLNLTQGSLVKVGGFKLDSNRSDQLTIIIHHLAVDGISWRILLQDIGQAYHQISQGEDWTAPIKTLSLPQWSEWLQQQAAELAKPDVEPSDTLHSPPQPPNSGGRVSLPTDYEKGENTVAAAQKIAIALSSEETQRLINQIPQAAMQAQGSQTWLRLLTALVQSLKEWSGDSQVQIDLESHGRTPAGNDVEAPLFPDLSHTVGWFTYLYTAQLQLAETGTLQQWIEEIQSQWQQAARQGWEHWLTSAYLDDVDSNPQPLKDICFNYLGQFDSQGGFKQLDYPGQTISPENQRPYLIEVNCWIKDKVFEMEWVYSRNHFRPETIQTVADAYLRSLRALIEQMLAPDPEASEVAQPDDFSLVDLDQSALDAVLSKVSFQQEVTS
ncbi:MAG: amino acid adenylation domain-containing protein [Cyanobacteria bacterium P01_F01_bin.42]